MSETEQPTLDIWDGLPVPRRQMVLTTLGSMALCRVRPAPPAKETSHAERDPDPVDDRARL